MGYTRIIEDPGFNITMNSVDYDTRGSLYGCGTQDNDTTDIYNVESSVAVVFKFLSQANGTPKLEWIQTLEPEVPVGPPGLMTYDYKNYTTCESVSWVGKKTEINNYNPATGYVVFVGNSRRI